MMYFKTERMNHFIFFRVKKEHRLLCPLVRKNRLWGRCQLTEPWAMTSQLAMTWRLSEDAALSHTGKAAVPPPTAPEILSHE